MKTFLRKFTLAFCFSLILSGCGSAPVAPTATMEPTATETARPPTATVSAPTTAPLASSLSERTVIVGALERTYYLYVPKNFNSAKPVPVVFSFHGYTGEGSQQVVTTGFNKLADANGFLAVYPNGTGPSAELSWNAGGCCGYAQANNIDESAFVLEILRDLGTGATIDSKRIYASGLSNGGFLSYRLACDLSGTFAAVAPVAGNLLYAACRPQQPVSVIHIHGSADEVVPFAGGGANPTWPPVQDGITAWAGFDGCDPNPQTEQNGIATHTVYSSCRDGSAVELYLLEGIGHRWPAELIWPTSQTIWDFFAAHPKA
jgi:polyhydroxybutyrate depolymerase